MGIHVHLTPVHLHAVSAQETFSLIILILMRVAVAQVSIIVLAASPQILQNVANVL